MKEMGTVRLEWIMIVVVVACCLEALSVYTWPHGFGKDLAPDLYR